VKHKIFTLCCTHDRVLPVIVSKIASVQGRRSNKPKIALMRWRCQAVKLNLLQGKQSHPQQLYLLIRRIKTLCTSSK
jgi:hypothetical protein